MKKKMMTLFVLSLCAVLLNSQTFTPVFTDNFNSSDSADVSVGNARQTGSLGVFSYTESNPTSNTWKDQIASNSLVVYANDSSVASWISLNKSFTDETSYQFSFYAQPVSGSTNSAIFTLGGADQTNIFQGYNFRIDGTGAFSFYSGTTLIATQALTTTAGYNFAITYANSTSLTLSATINGTTIDLNGASAGADFTGAALSSNYTYLGGLGTQNFGSVTYDDFSVAAIPEPSTYLFALVGFMIFVFGKKYMDGFSK